jgi:hypothetical protein
MKMEVMLRDRTSWNTSTSIISRLRLQLKVGRKGSRRAVLGFIRIDYTVIEKAVRFKKHNGMVKRLRYSSSKNNGMHAQKKKEEEKTHQSMVRSDRRRRDKNCFHLKLYHLIY